MMRVVNRVITTSENLLSATDYTLELLQNAAGYDELSRKMKVADKIVYCAIANGEIPYSTKTMDSIDRDTTVRGNKSNIQRSLTGLKEWNLISAYSGPS